MLPVLQERPIRGPNRRPMCYPVSHVSELLFNAAQNAYKHRTKKQEKSTSNMQFFGVKVGLHVSICIFGSVSQDVKTNIRFLNSERTPTYHVLFFYSLDFLICLEINLSLVIFKLKVQKAIRWFHVLRSFSRRRGKRVFSVIVPPFCLAVPQENSTLPFGSLEKRTHFLFG